VPEAAVSGGGMGLGLELAEAAESVA